MNKLNLLIIGAVFLVFTISCSSLMQGKQLAEPVVEQFNAQFNAKQFGEIYSQSDDKFKATVTEQQLTELLEALHRKLGTVTKSSAASWNVNTNTDGTFATVTYETDFSEGKGTEQFVFHITDDKALLYNHNVTSPLLITK